MTSQNLDLEEFVADHTFPGIPLVSVRITPDGGVSAPPESPLAIVTMIWKKFGTDEAFTLTTEGASPKIAITSASNWEFTIAQQILPLATAGLWRWIITGNAVDPAQKLPLLHGQVQVSPAP